MKSVVAIGLAVFLGGCAAFPDLNGTIPPEMERADFPRLVPVEPLLAGQPADRITPETETAMAARVAALKARASRLRRTVVDTGTRARMRAGVTGIVEG